MFKKLTILLGALFLIGKAEAQIFGPNIHSQDTLQSGTTFFTSSGTVAGTFRAGSIVGLNLSGNECVETDANGQLVTTGSGCGSGGGGSSATSAYGAIYLSSAAASQTLTTTLTKLSIFTSTGISNLTVPSASNDAISISTNVAAFVYAFVVSTNNAISATEYYYRIMLNGSPTAITCQNRTAQSCVMGGLLNLVVGDTVTISAAANATQLLNYTDAQLVVVGAGGAGGSGGGGIPAGSNGQYQFNNLGVFGADANLVTNGSTVTATSLQTSSLTVTANSQFLNVSTLTIRDVTVWTYQAGSTVAFASGAVINYQGGNGFLKASAGVVSLSTEIASGSTNYVQIGNTLQSGSTFYVSSGTVQGNLIVRGYEQRIGQPGFSAYNTTLDVNVTGDGTSYLVGFNTEDYDTTSNFNGSTFTATVSGKYLFNVAVGLRESAVGMTCTTFLVTSAATYGQETTIPVTGTSYPTGFSHIQSMSVGDTAHVIVKCSGGGKTVDVYGNNELINGNGKATFISAVLL